jgi:hypothetical protein
MPADSAKKKRHPRSGTGIKSTSNYFLRRNPEKYHAIVEMLGEGIAPRLIKKTLHVSQLTVSTIWDREAETITEHRQAYLRKARKLAQNMVDSITERLPQMDIQELLGAFGTLTDHIHDLEDELPAIELRSAGNPTFDEMIASLPSSADHAPERADGSELSQF